MIVKGGVKMEASKLGSGKFSYTDAAKKKEAEALWEAWDEERRIYRISWSSFQMM